MIPNLIFDYSFLTVVLAAVDLNNKFCFWAIEVDYVISNYLLPVELLAPQLSAPDPRPDAPFCISHVFSKFLGVFFEVLVVA